MLHTNQIDLSDEEVRSKLSPLMLQYIEVKQSNSNCLLLFRMGDFFEVFFEDAEFASKILNITLTKRGKIGDYQIPMAGIPYHALQDYLVKLTTAGLNIAICEQVENPEEARKRGVRSIVKRDVVRIITPGTIIEEDLLASGDNNFIASILQVKDKKASGGKSANEESGNRFKGKKGAGERGYDFALSYADVSTGEVLLKMVAGDNLLMEIKKIAPREILVPKSLSALFGTLLKDIKEVKEDQQAKNIRGTGYRSGRSRIVAVDDIFFNINFCRQRIANFYKDENLRVVNEFDTPLKCSFAALLGYFEKMFFGNLPKLNRPVLDDDIGKMYIDNFTFDNLEIFYNSRGDSKASLFNFVNRTATKFGSRLMKRWLQYPEIVLDLIRDRQEMVCIFHGDKKLIKETYELLKPLPDISRTLASLSQPGVSPQVLLKVRVCLAALLSLKKMLSVPLSKIDNRFATQLGVIFGDFDQELFDKLNKVLVDEPPFRLHDAPLFSKGYNQELDEAYELKFDFADKITRLQEEVQQKVGLKNLKIKSNNLFGYFVEVSKKNEKFISQFSGDMKFYLRQSQVNISRYSFAELDDLQQRLLSNDVDLQNLEKKLFQDFIDDILGKKHELSYAFLGLAHLDVFSAFASVALENNWCKPVLDDTCVYDVKRGAHSVVNKLLDDAGERYVFNDTRLSDQNRDGLVWLLTGPNMSGKSTFLRMNGHITILAQVGSFVPAASCEIGIVSSLFCRVGAADDMSSGKSTFMVEMSETAHILSRADANSLIILDEIGRGTSTFDGLSIAFALLELLSEKLGARTLFATHYHELALLNQHYRKIKNYTFEVKISGQEVYFLYGVKPGAAKRSYGIFVAKMAGMPDRVVSRAYEILEWLEHHDICNKVMLNLMDMPLFSGSSGAGLRGGKSESCGDKTVDLLLDNQKIKVQQGQGSTDKRPEFFTSDNLLEVKGMLEKIDPDSFTPRQAMDLLFELKKKIS